MLDRRVEVPPGYAERRCLLVSYRLPGLRHCHVLCHEAAAPVTAAERAALMSFFLQQAERLAESAVGDPQAFLLIHSGAAIRKRADWHLHVFVVQRRWQKAWVYAILALKNFALAGWLAVARPWRSGGPAAGTPKPPPVRAETPSP